MMFKIHSQWLQLTMILFIGVAVFSTWFYYSNTLDKSILKQNINSGHINYQSLNDNAMPVFSKQDYDVLLSRFAQLEMTLTALQEKVVRLERDIAQNASGLGLIALNSDESDYNSLEEQSIDIVQVQDIIAQHDNIFFDEIKDSSWAVSAEEQLSAIYESEQFDGIHDVSSDCKTSVCRMEFTYDDPEQQEAFLNTLSERNTMNFQLYDELEAGQQMRTVIYFSRRNYQAADNDAIAKIFGK